MSPPKPAEADLDFERLLADVSARFVNVPAGLVDGEIEGAQRSICECVGMDASSLWQWTPADHSRWTLTHLYRRVAEPPVPDPMVASEHFPWRQKTIQAGTRIVIESLSDLPVEADRDRATFEHFGWKSILIFPLCVGAGEPFAALAFDSRTERLWPERLVQRLALVADVFANALARKTAEDRLHHENMYLRQEARRHHAQARIVGHSAALQRAVEQAEQVAPTASTVLLLGETGTGKEEFASFIHDASPRRDRAMVRVNCSAIPATLIESELFGRERGAYTGAIMRQIGRFELANHSTIFLDEIGDLALDVQVKLLRVLQERRFERLGSPRIVSVDVRVIAASNPNLEQALHDRTFREDLYYRLAVFPIVLPPLRERFEDLPLLVEAIVEELAPSMGKRIEAVSRASLAALARYHWPGNVRELRNIIERALIVSSGPVLRIDVPHADGASGRSSCRLEDVERDHIVRVLRETGWRIRGPRGAAAILDLKATTLEARMRRLGIRRPRPADDAP